MKHQLHKTPSRSVESTSTRSWTLCPTYQRQLLHLRIRTIIIMTTITLMTMTTSPRISSFWNHHSLLPSARAFTSTTLIFRANHHPLLGKQHCDVKLSSSLSSLLSVLQQQQRQYSALKNRWSSSSTGMLFLSSQSYSSGTRAAAAAAGDDDHRNVSGYSRPVVQWYPGHIAKAERMLKETFKAVDVVVEVRDARIAKATSHPKVGAWCAGRPRLVVLTHVDQIPTASRRAWHEAYDKFGAAAAATSNHQNGNNVNIIDRQIQNQAKQAIQERLKYTPAAAAAIAAASSLKKNNKTKPPKRGSTTSVSSSSSIVDTVEDVLFVNAKVGSGIHALNRAIFKAGAHVQERRERRGLKDRPLRVGIIGYPNVGKSALINRLLGRRRARTANTPGVTRSLQWIRVKSEESKQKGNEFELLDSPGIIPATLVDQSDATLLAACNCIGDAAYDNQAVAAYLCEWLLSLYRLGYGKQCAPDWRVQCRKRYGFDPLQDNVVSSTDIGQQEGDTVAPWTGEDMLFEVADRTCQGNPEDAARKILQDFRAGRMGLICLQVAPVSSEEKGQRTVIGRNAARDREERQEAFEEAQRERARKALETAKERGLELPPVILEKQQKDQAETSSSSPDDQVGKGMFEGW